MVFQRAIFIDKSQLRRNTRESNGKACANTQRRGYFNFTAKARMYQIEDNMQAQTGSALTALGGKKRLEHVGQVSVRYGTFPDTHISNQLF